MRTLMIAAAASLMTLSALPVAAEPQMRPYAPQAPMAGPMNHGPMAHNGPVRPGPDGQYGTWDDRWGARPPAPPRAWARHSDWYRHVRACSQRYRSYDPRTDTFVVRRGRTAVCRL